MDNSTASTYRQGVVLPDADRGDDIADKRRRISIVSGNDIPSDHNLPRNVNPPSSPSPSSSSSSSSTILTSPKSHPAISRTTSVSTSRSPPPTLPYPTFDGIPTDSPRTDCHPNQWTPTTHRPVPSPIHHSAFDASVMPSSRSIHCRHCTALVPDCNTVRCQCGGGICIPCTQSYGERRATDHGCSWDNSRHLPESFLSRVENSELSPTIEPSPPVQRGITLTTHRRNASRWYINMLDTHKCGYCPAGFPHLIALQAHLNQTPFHDVFWCCQRLFKKSQDLMQHEEKVHKKKWAC
ncbi:hypothetical protein BC937DRAFT_93379 [Endogone sp. FLAS-F59071]|nr:hypothetical protein BC937DRAFT_93379 [Endogone sp. FLAS-F59071]|eukprot:RUS14761.1 hypothetical protein BC937DRAFT_93379 [Endogone sp. FLAS-F59071]